MGLEEYIWWSKYRPKSIADMTLEKEHRKAFNKFIKDKQIPHLLLEGPAGSGKTTMGLILTREELPCVVLTLNASGKEDRSMETMQTRVKQFAQSSAPKGKLKIVFMDEADGLLPPAQDSLKNIMETYSKSCRFILTCNHVDKITAPIQSRCTRFTFSRFPRNRAIKVCEDILDQEGIVEYSRDDVTEIVKRFYPDMRSTINNLQSACVSGELSLKSLGSLQVDPAKVVDLIKEGKVMSLRSYIAGTLDFMFLYRYIVDELGVIFDNNEQISEAFQTIGDSQRYVEKVPDREIEFVSCCLGLMDTLDVEADFDM